MVSLNQFIYNDNFAGRDSGFITSFPELCKQDVMQQDFLDRLHSFIVSSQIK